MFPFQKTSNIYLWKYSFIVLCLIPFFFMYQLTYDRNLLLRQFNVSGDIIKGQKPYSNKISSKQTSKVSVTEHNGHFGNYKHFVPVEYTNGFLPPRGETHKKRFPQALIIGFAKCGTRGLLEYIRLHPYIKVEWAEMHFYDRDDVFRKGYDWYKSKMPFSYSNQITLEKTPAYVHHIRTRTELKKYFPDTKLIALVRNPVDRLLSAYAQKGTTPSITEFRKFIRYHDHMDRTSAVNFSTYYTHLAPYYQDFKSSQILVLDGDRLVHDPLSVVQEVETFLEIPKMFSQDNFVKNKTTGFFCFKEFKVNANVKCLGSGKGRPHVTLPTEDADLLYSYFQPFNEKLYKLLNHTFNW